MRASIVLFLTVAISLAICLPSKPPKKGEIRNLRVVSELSLPLFSFLSTNNSKVNLPQISNDSLALRLIPTKYHQNYLIDWKGIKFENAKVKIFDFNGKLLQTIPKEVASKAEENVSLISLPKGIYYAQVVAGKSEYIQTGYAKFVVK